MSTCCGCSADSQQAPIQIKIQQRSKNFFTWSKIMKLLFIGSEQPTAENCCTIVLTILVFTYKLIGHQHRESQKITSWKTSGGQTSCQFQELISKQGLLLRALSTTSVNTARDGNITAWFFGQPTPVCSYISCAELLSLHPTPLLQHIPTASFPSTGPLQEEPAPSFIVTTHQVCSDNSWKFLEPSLFQIK